LAKTIQVFDYEIDMNGARIVAAVTPLHGGCLSDGEVDANIRALKDDLDAVGARMKVAIRRQKAAPLTFG
jgi:hypothetical protein